MINKLVLHLIGLGSITQLTLAWLVSFGLVVEVVGGEQPKAQSKRGLEFIRVSKDGRQFVSAESGVEFKAWGFNYDHDAAGRLLEEYWTNEWDAVVGDFEEMKALGANTVRIHLQVSRFMQSAQEANRRSLEQLARLVTLAQRTGLYLDVTGLGCYDKKDVPQWYNELNEGPRWEVQARFWEAVAQTCSHSPVVFCYDLMNEPVVTEDKKGRDWTPGAFGDRYFVQRLTLDFAGRLKSRLPRPGLINWWRRSESTIGGTW